MSSRDSVAKLDSFLVVVEPRFGTVDLTGVADSTAAIQAALDHAQAAAPNRGATVILPRGIYRTTAPLTITQRGVTLEGAGFVSTTTRAGATQLLIDHNDGAGLRISSGDTILRGFTIAGSTTRAAGSAGTTSAPCSGIHIEGPDAAGGSGAVQRVVIEDVCTQYHPADGLLIAGLSSVFRVMNVHSSFNGRHGIILNRGGITGRTNEGYTGIMNFANCRSHDNGGHMFAIGDPADTVLPAYRINLSNVEGYRNCGDAGVLFKDAFMMFCGQNITVMDCATGGEDETGTEHPGIWCCGRVHRYLNNRYIRTSQPAIVGAGGITTRDIVFDGMMISSPGLTPFDNAVEVEVDALVNQVRVFLHQDARGSDDAYVAPMECNAPGYWSQQSDGIRADFDLEMRSFASCPEFTLADDTVQEFDFGGLAGGMLIVNCLADSDINAIVAFRVGTTPHCVSLAAGADVALGTTALTDGTSDGTDTKLNIAAVDDGKLYLKNRRAGNRVLRVTILNGMNRNLTTYF